MPAVLGMNGFGARNTTRDRLTVTAGSLTYDTSNVPADSPSTTSIGGGAFVAPWFDDANSGRFVPSSEEFWFHGRWYAASNDASNDAMRLGVGRSGTELIAVSAQDNTNKVTLRVAGAVRAVATSATFRVGSWTRVHVHVAGLTAGDVISVYLDGQLSTPVLTYTLVADDESDVPNEFLVVFPSSSARCDDLVAWDPDAAGFPGIQFFAACGVAEQVFTGNGAETDWTGAYTAIDERPASDSDKITSETVGDESSFTKPAIGEPNVFAVKVLARVTRTGTTAGQNLTLKLNDGTNDDAVTVPAPTDGDVQAIFEAGPDGLAWTPTKYDATRVAFVTAT